MPSSIIIGSGHNGLVAAFYLARAGRRPIVFERRDVVGGGAITSEIAPGFRCPTLTHETWLHEEIVREMDLRKHGLELIRVDTDVCALAGDGPALVLSPDVARSVDSIRRFSEKDADAYAEWQRATARVAAVLAKAFTVAPPSIDAPAAADLWNLLGPARAFRGLSQRDRYRLLRWLPMPAADLVSEWFDTELLRAVLAAPGTSGTMLGPWSAGSSLVMLMRAAHRQLAGGAAQRVRGGPGALTKALAEAATAAGAEIRTGTAVDKILVRNERVTGVVCGGEEFASDLVISAIDPKTTFLKLLDPSELMPEFLGRMRNYRAAGTVAKINLALSALPHFRGVDDASALAGRIHIGPDLDYLERAFDHAKYGEMSESPWLDVTIPSILDPALAPAGAHVASVYVHVAPYHLRAGNWDTERATLLQRTLRVLASYAPGITASVVEAQVITPADLEATYGFAGGHIFHGELAPDQLFTMRPVIGHGRYDSPIDGLFLCGAGTHPGGFMSGVSGRIAARRVIRHVKGQTARVKGEVAR